MGLSKKAQEEMVGFVVIMLVVAIIFLVFLGIFLRSSLKNQTSESKDLESYIEAMFDFTTSCGPDSTEPIKLNQLIIACATTPDADCSPGDNNGCAELEKIFRESINSTWNFDKNSLTKAYSFQILRETNEGEKSVLSRGEIFGPPSGTRTNVIRQAEKPLPNGIIVRLQVFY